MTNTTCLSFRATRGGGAARRALRRFITAIEPWYDWGIIHIERMQELRTDDGGRVAAGGEGIARFFVVQWLGIHAEVQIGRTPTAVR